MDTHTTHKTFRVSIDIDDLMPTECEQHYKKVDEIAAAMLHEPDQSRWPAIIATDDRRIIDGHHRWQAWDKLGYGQVPAIVLDADLTEEWDEYHDLYDIIDKATRIAGDDLTFDAYVGAKHAWIYAQIK